MPQLLRARTNPVKEAALARLVEARANGPAQLDPGPKDPAEAKPTALAPQVKSASSAEPGAAAPDGARATSGRRIEDLPAASPVAYRPLRVEELPEAPGSGKKGRRVKDAAAPSSAGGKEAAVAAVGSAGRALRIEDLPSVSAAVRPLRPDELNPELVKMADDLLWNHPSPVGVDVPLEVKGKSYVARFAYHYHEFGGAKKPWGYHKGVTLYSTTRD